MTPTSDQARRRAARIVEVARAFTADPNDHEKRLAYLKATFNLDWTAAVIVALADTIREAVEFVEDEADNRSFSLDITPYETEPRDLADRLRSVIARPIQKDVGDSNPERKNHAPE